MTWLWEAFFPRAGVSESSARGDGCGRGPILKDLYQEIRSRVLYQTSTLLHLQVCLLAYHIVTDD